MKTMLTTPRIIYLGNHRDFNEVIERAIELNIEEGNEMFNTIIVKDGIPPRPVIATTGNQREVILRLLPIKEFNLKIIKKVAHAIKL